MQNSTTLPNKRMQPAGMTAFGIIWIGQLISFIGTGMTRFATTVWAYQTTGSAEALALVGFFSFAPVIIMTPIAGALVDRWNRKLVMIMADLGAALSTVVLLTLYATGNLQVWHLMVAGTLAGIFESFQFPAFSASITTMLKKEQYTRANGMLSLAESASGIIAPLLAGFLLAMLGLGGIFFIDIITCAIAVLTMIVVFIPQPPVTAEGAASKGSLLQDAIYGFKYIWKRPSLLGLQTLFFFSNLFGAMSGVLFPAMILARTANNAATLGVVQTAFGVGGVAGGLLMSTWGGPKRRVHGVLLGFIGSSLLGNVLMGIGQTVPIWYVAAFFWVFFIPFLNGSNQAIWQSKVAPDVQGRVFSARRLIAQVSSPLGMLVGGMLADRIFEPMMSNVNSAGAQAFGWLVGTGPGAGMGLLFVIMGTLGALVGVAGYFVRVIRNAEDLLPDHVSTTEEPIPAAEPAPA